MSNFDNLLVDVLQKVRLTALPKPVEKNNILWIDAVVKARLQNNSIAYGICERNADLEEKIVYINGDTSAIAFIEEYYPIHFIAKEYIKTFRKDDDRESRIKYLNSQPKPHEGIDYNSLSIEELNKEIIKNAFYQQLNFMEETKNGR